MAKFGQRGVGSRLSLPVLDAPRRALRSLLQRAHRRDVLNFSGPTAIEYSQLHDTVLRAEYQKTLGYYYLEKRKLTLI
jgi:hypothetical protein